MSDILEEKVKTAVQDLIEHCDGVIILASIVDSETESTYLIHRYMGSFHTVLGMLDHYRSMKIADKISADLNGTGGDEEDE